MAGHVLGVNAVMVDCLAVNFTLNCALKPNKSLLMTESLADIDRIDLKILNVLQQDGRISNLKLADAVTLSPTAVLARVQRLTRDGYILGYEARLNPLKLGAGHDGVCGGAAGPHHAQCVRRVQGRRAGAPRNHGVPHGGRRL
jgi:hypothetical protein